MKESLSKYLIKKFPKLYTDYKSEELFSSQDGWFRILLWMSRYLQSYIDQQNEYSQKFPDKYLPVEQIKILQVKEKFGTLRIYTSGGNQHTQTVINFIEYISGFVCEFTGQTDDVGFNTKGWIKTTHISKTKSIDDFHYIDDLELRNILNNKLTHDK